MPLLSSKETGMSDVFKAIRAWCRGRSLRVSLLGSCFLLGGSADVWADGWKIQLQGVKALGLGYAGRAVAEDASTVWFNPAGMTNLDRRCTITLGSPVITYKLDYTDLGSLSLLGQRLTGPTSSNG